MALLSVRSRVVESMTPAAPVASATRRTLKVIQPPAAFTWQMAMSDAPMRLDGARWQSTVSFRVERANRGEEKQDARTHEEGENATGTRGRIQTAST